MSLTSLLAAQGDFCVLRGEIIDKLVKCGDADGALLYLYVLRQGKHFDEKTAMRDLRFSQAQYERAAFTLSNLDLKQQSLPAPEKKEASPGYHASELRQARGGDRRFAAVCDTAESVLERTLTESQLRILFTLYDHLGLPAEVIIELLTYLKRNKPKVTRRDIEQEGYHWADMGLFTAADAAAYLSRMEAEQPLIESMMEVLNLGKRPPSAREYRYLSEFIARGFPPESVALAASRTNRALGKFSWNYLSKILASWDQKGIHTLAEITALEPERAENKQSYTPQPARAEQSAPVLSDWEKEWIEEIKARRIRKAQED